MIKCLAKLWTTNLRYRWSNWLHRASPRATDVRSDLRPATMAELQKTAEELYRNFAYTPDGPLRLFDSIDTPAGSWERAFNPGPLKDDCDGFHGALYWAASINLICYLLTIVTVNIIDSHTLLCVDIDGKKYFVDYTHFSKGYDNIVNMVKGIQLKRNMKGILLVEGTRWRQTQWCSEFTIHYRRV